MSANLNTTPNYRVTKRILATWIRSQEPGMLLFQLALSDVGMHTRACVHNLCVYLHVSTYKHRYIHTHKIYYSNLLFQMSVCTLWVMYTYLHTLSAIGWVWNPKGWPRQAPKLYVHLSCWEFLATSTSTEADQPFKEIWQLAAEDKNKRLTHRHRAHSLMLRYWCQRTILNYNG